MQKRKILETSKASGKNTNFQNNLKPEYQINHHRLFEKEILRAPDQIQQKTYRILTAAKNSPTSLPPNTTSFKGYKNTYRTRLGKYRLIYQIKHTDKVIFVLGIDTRGKVYKIIRRLLG